MGVSEAGSCGIPARPPRPMLPVGAGGQWRPGLLGELLLQLLEAFLGSPFGPEVPQANREALVQHILHHEGPHAIEGDQAQQQQLEAGISDVP